MKKEQNLNLDEFKNFIENKSTTFINDLLDRFKLWNLQELNFYINHIFSYKMQRPFLFLNYLNNKGYSKHERNNRIKKYMNCFINYLDKYYKEHTQEEEQQEINKSDVKAYLDINNNRILKKMFLKYPQLNRFQTYEELKEHIEESENTKRDNLQLLYYGNTNDTERNRIAEELKQVYIKIVENIDDTKESKKR